MWGRGYTEEPAAGKQAGARGSTKHRRLQPSAVPRSRYCQDRLVPAQTSTLSWLPNLPQDLSIFFLPSLEGCERFQIYKTGGQRLKGWHCLCFQGIVTGLRGRLGPDRCRWFEPITRPKLQVTERQPKLSSWKCTRANLYVKGFYQAAAMQPSGGELAQHTWALGPVPSKAKPKQSSGYPPLNLWAVGLSPRNQAVIVAF